MRFHMKIQVRKECGSSKNSIKGAFRHSSQSRVSHGRGCGDSPNEDEEGLREHVRLEEKVFKGTRFTNPAQWFP
jgi:hypothetical protein